MAQHQQNWPPWPPLSQPHGLETENRLTKLEVRSSDHEKRHEAQDIWNKTFTVALLGLGSGLAHAKVPEMIELFLGFLKH